jgi:hypothetical protein
LYPEVMATDAETVLQEALALPDQDRADVAARLLASLEPLDDEDAASVRAAWGHELGRRARRALSGEDVGEDWATVRRRLADELAG